MIWYKSDELCHFGIRGMHWGVRRFQNEDGSLKPAGKKRLNLSDDQKKKIKKVLIATATIAAVAGAAYAGKKYFDSQKAKDVMSSKLGNLDSKAGKGKGVLSGFFAERKAIKSAKANRAAYELTKKRSREDWAKVMGMTNSKDIKRYAKGGKAANLLARESSLRDRAKIMGITDSKAINKYVKDNIKRIH